MKRSKEEKEKLVENFKSSGLSLAAWCAANNIPRTTMADWLHGKNTGGIREKNTKFIEVTPPVNFNEKQESFITIEYRDFKITVRKNTDFGQLENTLRVVKQLNV